MCSCADEPGSVLRKQITSFTYFKKRNNSFIAPVLTANNVQQLYSGFLLHYKGKS